MVKRRHSREEENSVSNSRLQEIITKAVVGRAGRRIAWGHSLAADGITNVLGVHVSDTTVNVKDQSGRPVIELIAQCELWCSDGKGTRVMSTQISCEEEINLQVEGEVLGDSTVRVGLVGEARSTAVSVAEGVVMLSLEADMAVEMTALTRMWIQAYEPNTDAPQESSEDSGANGNDSGSNESGGK